MTRNTRYSRATTAALILCLFGQCTPLFASDGPPTPAPATPLTFNGAPLAALGPLDSDRPAVLRSVVLLAPADANQFAQFGGFRGRRRGGRNQGAAAALFLGAAGVIAGSAVLVYANRPECSVNANFGGCGYGTKVVGGAVLSAGLAGLLIGAVTWR